MEKIRIGSGPDFCMFRGLEIVNYRIEISGVYNLIEFKPRIVVDRSLAMVIKKLRQNLPVVISGQSFEFERSGDQNCRFELSCSNLECYLQIQFYLPQDLMQGQVIKIMDNFATQFKSSF